MFVIIFGPPGSGKGTQSKKIAEAYGIKQITTGDIFREHIKRETALGKKAKEYINKGLLVPDEIINGIVEEELKKSVYKSGFIFDGYPRTMNQVDFLDKLLIKIKLDAVVNLVVDEKEIIRRLTSRRMCSSCQSIFNLVFNPPKKPGICDNCGGKLIQRDDDNEDVIKERLNVYKKQTEQVLHYYKDTGKLHYMNGKQDAEKVFEEIKQVLDKFSRKERTLVIIKSDGVKKGLEKKIVRRYEDVGLKMIKRKELTPSTQLLKQHYSAHVAKPFYHDLEKFMSSGTAIVMVFEGANAVAVARKVTGATDPAKAEKGTIRRDLGDLSLPDDDRIMMNLVHASATKDEAEKEIKLWFG